MIHANPKFTLVYTGSNQSAAFFTAANVWVETPSRIQKLTIAEFIYELRLNDRLLDHFEPIIGFGFSRICAGDLSFIEITGTRTGAIADRGIYRRRPTDWDLTGCRGLYVTLSNHRVTWHAPVIATPETLQRYRVALVCADEVEYRKQQAREKQGVSNG